MNQEFLEINTEWVYSNIYSLEGYPPKMPLPFGALSSSVKYQIIL